MPQVRVTETKVLKFDELSDQAKEKARDWFRQAGDGDNFWSESVIEDAAACGEIIGINLCARAAKLMGGGTRMEPCVYWSGFSSQGDGACFEGDYQYAKGAAKKIRDHAPQDTELHRIADELQKIQSANFYRVTASTKHSGRYYHEHCMDVSVDDDGERRVKDWLTVEEGVTELMRDFARWIYRQLEKEYDWTNADEQVDESIRCNEYKFNEEGGIE